MILTISNAKGGTGKSAIAYLLALHLAEKHGKDNVICIDADEAQASFQFSLTKNTDGKISEYLNFVRREDMGKVCSETPADKYVVIDTAPSLTDYTKQAIRACNLVVAPTILTTKIIQQTLDFATMVVRDAGKKYIIVPNLCSHNPSYTEKLALEKLTKAQQAGFNVYLNQTYAYENLKKNIDNSDPNWSKGLTVPQRENITQTLEAILAEVK